MMMRMYYKLSARLPSPERSKFVINMGFDQEQQNKQFLMKIITDGDECMILEYINYFSSNFLQLLPFQHSLKRNFECFANDVKFLSSYMKMINTRCILLQYNLVKLKSINIQDQTHQLSS